MSNFEFWLELAWLGEMCEGKTLLVIEKILYPAQILHFHSPQTSIGAQYPKQNMIKFSQCLAELAQKFKFLLTNCIAK